MGNYRNGRAVALAVGLGVAVSLLSQSAEIRSQPPGKGKKGQGGDPAFVADRDVFHFLLEHRKDIRRTVKNVENGVQTVTESDNVEVAKKIQDHAEAMHKRVKEGWGIHLRDPLFAELFRHAGKIAMVVERTKNGVRVSETSSDAHVARLIQAHAVVVSRFIENGFEEVHKNHAVPR